MRARTRFLLDIGLMIALVAAYRPTWTGVALHQWLSIAIIAPLLIHVVVNWEWALRILRTFVERLLHASRVNFVVDTGLLVSTIAVMLSGFMVSPALIAPLGITPSNPLVWHYLHLWSANATILLLALHGGLHWRWIVGTAKRLAESPAPALARRGPRAATGAPRTALAGTPSARRSHIGLRAAQAAAERAMAVRAASVIGITGMMGLAIFAGVSTASALIAPASQPHPVASAAGLQVCPQTGCKASTCHGTTHADPTLFYGRKPSTDRARAQASALPVSRRRGAGLHVASASPAASRASAAGTRGPAHTRVASAKHASRTAPASASGMAKPRALAAKPVVHHAVKRLMTCPSTGCQASSCHGAHHQSASSYYG